MPSALTNTWNWLYMTCSLLLSSHTRLSKLLQSWKFSLEAPNKVGLLKYCFFSEGLFCEWTWARQWLRHEEEETVTGTMTRVTGTNTNGGKEWECLQLNLESHIWCVVLSLITSCPGEQGSPQVFRKRVAPERCRQAGVVCEMHRERLRLPVPFVQTCTQRQHFNQKINIDQNDLLVREVVWCSLDPLTYPGHQKSLLNWHF